MIHDISNSHDVSQTTTTISTTRQTLLETINEREVELKRIRLAADKIADEEKKEYRQQLHSLQSELLENQKLLTDKDELIQTLQSKINILEQDFLLYQTKITDRSKEEAEWQVEKIRNRLENDYQNQVIAFKEKEQKRLQLEFEEKLTTCEKKIHCGYQESLLSELQKQEEMLWLNFDKIISDKEARFVKQEKELHNKLRDTEKELANLSSQYESNLILSQESLMNELKVETEMFALKSNEYKKNINNISAEKDEIIQRYEYLQEKLSYTEKENSHGKEKLQELLEVIECVEKNYNEKLQEFQYIESNQQGQINSLSNQIETLKKELCETKLFHRKEMKTMRKSKNQAKKSMQDLIEELKRDITSIECMKSKEEETMKRLIKQKDTEIKLLSEEIENVRHDFEKNKDMKNQAEKRKDQIQRELEREYEKEAQYKISEKELKDKVNMEKIAYDREISYIMKERDAARRDKESVNFELTQIKEGMAAVQRQSSIDKEDMKMKIVALEDKNKLLQLNLDEAARDKIGLKDTITTMRREMEEFMTLPSSNQSISTSPHVANEINLGGSSELQMLKSVLNGLNRSSLKMNENQVGQIKGILDRICKSVGHTEEVQNIRQKLICSENRVKKLECLCQDLSSELEIISSERENLIDLSNKLKSDIARTKREEDTAFIDQTRDIHGAEISSNSNDVDFCDGIDVTDLAKSLWSKAIQGSSDEVKQNIPIRVSERTTSSQKLSLQNLRSNINKSKGKDSLQRKRKIKVRNWNCKDDQG